MRLLRWLFRVCQTACRFKIELWSSIGIIAWSLWLWIIPDALDVNPAYDVVKHLLGEDAWSMFAGMVGLAQLASVLGEFRLARILCAGLASVFWGLLGYAFLLSGHPPPGSIPHLAWCLANAHSMARDVGKPQQAVSR